MGIRPYNTTNYYATNLQGDVIAILDSTGTVMVNYHYDAYGVLLQTGGTMAATLGTLNPLTYRGYVYDHETGLYYLQSRYYNPAIRQFISADAYISTGQGYMGYNMFAYCLNNPVCFADPTGTYSIYDTRAIFGGGGIGGPGAMYVTGVPSLASVGGYVADAAVSVCVVACIYNEVNEQSETPASDSTMPSAPIPPKPDDDDNDDLGETQEIGKGKDASSSRGSTGRTEPNNLKEKLAMEQAKADPSAGKILTKIKLNDRKWPASEGWVKMQQITHTLQGDIIIHYVYNLILKVFDDFKFVP